MNKFMNWMVLSIALVLPQLGIAEETVNINDGSIQQIARTLKGIGVKRAAAIVAYREKNGDFTSIEELAKVKGISKKLVGDNRERISLGGEESSE